MRNSERGKITSYGFMKQLVGKAGGIEAYREAREELKSFPDRMTTRVFAGVIFASTIFNPIAERFIKEGRDRFPVIIGLLLDQGITFNAIMLALSGHIGEGVAVKAVYNIGANLLPNKTPKKPTPSSAGTK